MSIRAINTDLEALNLLSSFHPYFRTAIPIELILSLAGFSLSLFSIYTGYGLWKGESWSIKNAYFVSIGVFSITIIGLILYSSAPSELEIPYTSSIFSAVWNIIFLGGVWSTLQKQDVVDFIQAKNIVSDIHSPNIPNTSQEYLQDPMQILKVRFAKGEITQEEFQRMKTELTTSTHHTTRCCSSCDSEVPHEDMFCSNCGLRVV